MENLLPYILIGLGIMVIILAVFVGLLAERVKKLSAGKNAESLESIITETNALAHELKQTGKEHHEHIIDLRNKLAKTIQNISVIRFDALKDSGGMQSFAIGLTDSHKNGVVISSMYARDRMNVFAKEITNGTSKHRLTAEETEAINN